MTLKKAVLLPGKKYRKPAPREWAKAEEMYRMGSTQREISELLGVRVEAVSRHMTSAKVVGGESINKARAEIEAKLLKAKREFAEKLAKRKIQAKETTYILNTALRGQLSAEIQAIKARGGAAAEIGPAAKATKDAIEALDRSYELDRKILGITEDEDREDKLPELHVVSMTEAEEEELRNTKALVDEDAIDQDNIERTEEPAPAIEEPSLDETLPDSPEEGVAVE